MEDNFEFVAAIAGILLFFVVVFGWTIIWQSKKNDCVKILEGRPAAEIKLVCG